MMEKEKNRETILDIRHVSIYFTRYERGIRRRKLPVIRDLDLRKPIYRQLAAYGHMGREDLGVNWEKTDRVEALKAAVAEL